LKLRVACRMVWFLRKKVGAEWGDANSGLVYLMRRSVLSLSFVEPNKRDRPMRPDEPDPRHAPGNGRRHFF
jgi:hypothetical protein